MRDTVTRALRAARHVTGSVTGALGLFLIVGLFVAGLATWSFDELAETIEAGTTPAIDTRVIEWMGAHQSPFTTAAALEITALGTASVVLMLAGVTALFLILNRQRDAGMLLLVATVGGLFLNMVLKLHYHRERPHLFAWDTQVISSSFPSGHATNAVIVYGTIAYLLARQLRRRWTRLTVMTIATLLIFAIALSRLYLGVHYPSDVLGGVIIGAGWAAFCMAALDGVQRLWGRRPTAAFTELTDPNLPPPTVNR